MPPNIYYADRPPTLHQSHRILRRVRDVMSNADSLHLLSCREVLG